MSAEQSSDRLVAPTGRLVFPSTHDIPFDPIVSREECVDPELPLSVAYNWTYQHAALAGTLGLPVETATFGVFEFQALFRELTEEQEQELIVGDEKTCAELMLNPHLLRYLPGQVVARRSRPLCAWSSVEAGQEVHASPAHRETAPMSAWAYESGAMGWHHLAYAADLGQATLSLMSMRQLHLRRP